MSTLFNANLIVNLFFGLGFSILPRLMMSLYGVEFADGAYAMVQLFGAALLSTVVLLWYVRRSENQEFIAGSARSMLTYWILGSIVILLAQLAGVFNWLAWGTLGFHLIFVVWYVYKLFVRP